jgi:hypothetical protein
VASTDGTPGDVALLATPNALFTKDTDPMGGLTDMLCLLASKMIF